MLIEFIENGSSFAERIDSFLIGTLKFKFIEEVDERNNESAGDKKGTK
jgi:hypothetical protein